MGRDPLGLAEGATENAATVQALIDNLVERGLDPAVPRLFIIDGAKALSKAIRRTSVRRDAACAVYTEWNQGAENRAHRHANLGSRRADPRSDHGQWRTRDPRRWHLGPRPGPEQALRAH
jgi:hypothetical protein